MYLVQAACLWLMLFRGKADHWAISGMVTAVLTRGVEGPWSSVLTLRILLRGALSHGAVMVLPSAVGHMRGSSREGMLHPCFVTGAWRTEHQVCQSNGLGRKISVVKKFSFTRLLSWSPSRPSKSPQ